MIPYANIVVPIGRNFLNVNPSSGTVTQVVSPSQNTSEVIIRTADMIDGNLYADLSPPSGPGDTTKRVIFNANPGVLETLPYPLFVPPSLGVWFVAESESGINITWDLVSADISASIN